ncbi:hypothetical protein ACFQ48_03630 [Hymenobacter caeli]|uniref:T9SS C-terminal target domain-containing protein n=1 Tax=Hymenobacter caeli TaxID=2735894 RepID=A0ABX2FLH9_9BACT|nr:hypothetical protein [Hymenobacter caeli]NRT17993.1 hypothetical protein [Hymenobacter caeli]
MKKNTLSLGFVAALLLGLASCQPQDITPAPNAAPNGGTGTGTGTGTGSTNTAPVVAVQGEITTNTTWTAANQYLLQGYVYVRSGATVTIEAGTLIKGDKDSKGSLIIEPGAKLIAIGTVAKPIVFTSNQPKGARNYGDWGGVILCGNAPVNTVVNGVKPQVEGGPTTRYGSADPTNTAAVADNSGTLQYVRIEFGGVAFSPNNEINGLTLCGVGNGTTIDHIQVSYSGDDSYEWFGGTVNAKYLVAHRGFDDDFDTDSGFSGKLQFLVSLRDPLAADQSGSKGFESDNDANNTDNTPKTSAVFSNVTLVGPLINPSGTGGISSQYVAGVHIRRNSAISLFNSVVMGWPTGVLIDGTKAGANVASGALAIKNTIVAGSPTGSNSKGGQKDVIYIAGAGGAGSLTPTNTMSADSSAFGTAVGPLTWLFASANANRKYSTSDAVRLLNPFNLTSPSFLPSSTSPIVYNGTTSTPAVAASFADAKVSDAFFTKVAYVGAFAGTGATADNWTAGWTNFDPQNTNY